MVRCVVLHGKGLGKTNSANAVGLLAALTLFYVPAHRFSLILLSLMCRAEIWLAHPERFQRQSDDVQDCIAILDRSSFERAGGGRTGFVIAPGLFANDHGGPLVAAIERAVAKGVPCYEVHASNFAKKKVVSAIGHAVTAQIVG